MDVAGMFKISDTKCCNREITRDISLARKQEETDNLGSSPCTTSNPVVVVKHNYSGACFLSANRRFDLS
jgi:hypothetical protein